MAICHLVAAMGGELKPDLRPQDCLVAVDAGYKTLQSWGLSPDLLVGDFDSLGYIPQGKEVVALPVEKDHTDMGYALELARKRGYRSFLLQGGLGGRFDHSLGNLQLLLSLAQTGCAGILLGQGQNVLVLHQSSLTLPPSLLGDCSIFALGGEARGVTLKNLAYTLEESLLSPAFPLGVSNQFLSGLSAQISVSQGSLAVIWHGLEAQSLYEEILNELQS